MISSKPSTIDEYIALFPKPVRKNLEEIRRTIQNAAPQALETISYAMPAFTFNGKNLVYFAAFKDHIGFYSTPTSHEEFKEEFSHYKTGKGSVQFPLDQPMPLALIAKVVKFKLKNQK